MKKLRFSKSVEKYCNNCRFGKYLEFSDEVFCTKRGLVDKFDKCFRYKYDPLKRVPETISLSIDYKKEDFKL